MKRRELEQQVRDLEERVEGLENLLADLTQDGRITVQMTNGRGLSPHSAQQLRDLPKAKG